MCIRDRTITDLVYDQIVSMLQCRFHSCLLYTSFFTCFQTDFFGLCLCLVVYDPVKCRCSCVIVECHGFRIACIVCYNCCVFAFFYTEFFDICEIFVFAVDDCDCIIDFEFLDSLCIMYSNSRDLAEAVTISFTLNTYIRRLFVDSRIRDYQLTIFCLLYTSPADAGLRSNGCLLLTPA